jgi:hypothetical protein
MKKVLTVQLFAVIGYVLFNQVEVNAQDLMHKTNQAIPTDLVSVAIATSESEPSQIPGSASLPSPDEIIRVAILAVFGVTVIKAMKS